MNEIIAESPCEPAYHPDKYQDPRTLSEAWKTALFGPKVAKARKREWTRLTYSGEKAAAGSTHTAKPAAAGQAAALQPGAVQALEPNEGREPAGAGTEAAAVRARFARKAAPQQPQMTQSEAHSERHQAFLTVGKDEARIRLLIQQHGADLRVVAVTNAERLRAVSTTLEHVRRELATRGVRLHIESLEEQPI